MEHLLTFCKTMTCHNTELQGIGLTCTSTLPLSLAPPNYCANVDHLAPTSHIEVCTGNKNSYI